MPEELHLNDEQTLKLDSLREDYLRWLQQQESRLSGEDRDETLRPNASRRNIDSCTW